MTDHAALRDAGSSLLTREMKVLKNVHGKSSDAVRILSSYIMCISKFNHRHSLYLSTRPTCDFLRRLNVRGISSYWSPTHTRSTTMAASALWSSSWRLKPWLGRVERWEV